MTKQLYRFHAQDRYSGKSIGGERYVHISTYGDNRRVVDQAGFVGDEWLTKLLNNTAARTDGTEFIARAPTLEEFGRTNEFDFHYRKAVGRPVATFTEFFEANRAWAIMPFHVLKVVDFAHEVGAIDSLYEKLAGLCCNADEVPVFSYDSERSLFWQMVTTEEHEFAVRNMPFRSGDYIIPRKENGRYHGGLIAHQSSRDGSWDYSVHT